LFKEKSIEVILVIEPEIREKKISQKAWGKGQLGLGKRGVLESLLVFR